MKDVAAFYAAFVQGLPDPLPPLPAQYSEHVAEERERATSPMRQTRLAYWHRQLEGTPELLQLLTDRPRPNRAGPFLRPRRDGVSGAAARRAARQGEESQRHVDHGTARWFERAVVAPERPARYCDRHPRGDRRRPAYRQAMGLFVNTLALRTDLRDNPSADALLDRVRSVGQPAYPRQDVPFEQVVELVRPA
jgi:hypothetical protein